MGRSGAVVPEIGQICGRYPAAFTIETLAVNKNSVRNNKKSPNAFLCNDLAVRIIITLLLYRKYQNIIVLLLLQINITSN